MSETRQFIIFILVIAAMVGSFLSMTESVQSRMQIEKICAPKVG